MPKQNWLSYVYRYPYNQLLQRENIAMFIYVVYVLNSSINKLYEIFIQESQKIFNMYLPIIYFLSLTCKQSMLNVECRNIQNTYEYT